MLSRFSVLSAYLVTSLVASTLATPMIGQSSVHGGDSMKKPYKHDYAQERPYAHHQADSCDVSKQQCCNQVTKASEHEASDLLSLFSGTGLFDVNSLVGKNCSPFMGKGGECSANAVCCEQTKFEGLIAAGCKNLNLDIF